MKSHQKILEELTFKFSHAKKNLEIQLSAASKQRGSDINLVISMIDDIFKVLDQLGLPKEQCTHETTSESPGLDKVTDSLVKKELYLKLASKLREFIKFSNKLSLLDDVFFNDINQLIIELVMKYPFNDSTFVTLESFSTIPSNRIVYTTSGYQFDLTEIIAVLKKNQFIIPYTNEYFSFWDIAHIINTCIQYNKIQQDSLTVEYIGSLGHPTKVVYKNQILFLLDAQDKPFSLFKDSLKEAKVSTDKLELIKFSNNVRIALYENLMSLQDIQYMPYENLKMLHSFGKSISVLRSLEGGLFLKQLKSKEALYIFSILNRNTKEALLEEEKQTTNANRHTLAPNAPSRSHGSSEEEEVPKRFGRLL